MLTQIVGRPILWFILTFVPCANIVALWFITRALSERLREVLGFGIGLFLLGPIFFPMLGFSDAQYSGPSFKG